MSHDHGGGSDTMDDDAMATGHDHDHDHDPFCSGDGTVMLNGFQAATKASASCVLFLFEDAVVDTKTKYVFAIIGVFLLGFTNELFRHGRDLHAKGAFSSLPSGDGLGASAVRTVGFAIQMLMAYFIMLLVMLYEYVFLIAIILGLSTGHLLTLRLTSWRKEALRANGEKTPPEVVGSSGTPCCNTGTCTA